MKIVVATTIGRTMSAFLREQIALLADHGHEVVLLCSEPDEIADVDVATIEPAPWDRPIRVRALPGAITRTRVLLRRVAPDVLYTHTAIASAITRLAVLGWRDRPAVAYCAHGFAGAQAQPALRRVPARIAERVLGRVTDLLIVMNDEDEHWARSARVASHIRRIPSIGVDLERYSAGPARPEGPFTMLTIAELTPRKRVELTIEATARTDERFTLTVLGDGPRSVALRARTDELGVADRVRFEGQVADVRPFLDTAWVVVSTARQEGLPRGLLEAAASGVPSVGVAARGVTDVLAGGAGILVPDADAADVAREIVRLADDPDAWLRCRDAALATAERHDVGVIAPHVVDLLEQLGDADGATTAR